MLRMRHFAISDPWSSPMATSPVIDLSHWNPTPNWAEIKKAGVVGVIHKATEGTSYQDPTRGTRMRDAQAAGLLTSTYHFMRPGSMRQQMDHYLAVVQPLHGELVVLDHEDYGVELWDLEEAVSYLHEVRPDLHIVIYSGHVIKEQLNEVKSDILADLTDLWVAQYGNHAEPEWPEATWPKWHLWQWTDHETVPGISQAVDGNKFNGSEEELEKWMSPDAVGHLPPVTVADEVAIQTLKLAGHEVTAQLDTGSDTISVWVDGVPWAPANVV